MRARLYLLTHRQHSSDQVQQQAAKVVLGHQHLPVAIQADVVDRGTGDRPVRRRYGQGAAGDLHREGSR